MSIQAPTAITSPPTAPDPADRSTWNTRAYAFFVTWFHGTFVAQLTAAISNVWNNATEAYTHATNAQTASSSATAAAAAATSVASAALWASGTYAEGAAAISRVNYLTYRRTSVSPGADATDPANDTTGKWVNVGLPPVTIVDVSSDTTMVAGMIYRATAVCTLTLPTSPARGDAVTVVKTAAGYTVTIGRNSHKIRTLAENGTVTTKDRYYTLTYVDTTVGWDVL